jgi:phosphate transport system permease protein
MSGKRLRQLKDRAAGRAMGALALLAAGVIAVLVVALAVRAYPLLDVQSPIEMLTSLEWHPFEQEFGMLTFVAGTAWVTLLAMLLAVPPCLLCAIYLAEYAPRLLGRIVRPMIDLLAGVPSVVYGLWGILMVVPFVRAVATILSAPCFQVGPLLRADNLTGYGVLAGGVVLAVMVSPIILSVSEEVIRAVPDGMREVALALGATRWQMIKSVVLRRARPGIVAAIVLALSRAFGETMAVMMVVGNVPQIPHSLFDAAYPLPALIANNYGEMMSIPLYDSALMGAALLLLLVVLVFTVAARIILLRAVGKAS